MYIKKEWSRKERYRTLLEVNDTEINELKGIVVRIDKDFIFNLLQDY